jgi:hypothetical protein
MMTINLVHHTRKELKEKCREILNKYPKGTYISDIDDFEFMCNIFERHPEAETKIGCGIRKIIIGTDSYKGKCFYIQRNDLSQTDISFLKSIDGKPTKISDIKSACRSAVESIIIKFRQENVCYGISTCSITGQILTKDNTHIDHYDLTFAELFEKWIKNQNIDYLYSKINPTTDNECKTYFTDEKIIKEFAEFHNNNTHLRAVTKKVNMILLRKK